MCRFYIFTIFQNISDKNHIYILNLLNVCKLNVATYEFSFKRKRIDSNWNGHPQRETAGESS